MPARTTPDAAASRSFGKTASFLSSAGIAAAKQTACTRTTVRKVPGIRSSGRSLLRRRVASLARGSSCRAEAVRTWPTRLPTARPPACEPRTPAAARPTRTPPLPAPPAARQLEGAEEAAQREAASAAQRAASAAQREAWRRMAAQG
eukprot:CAMPEP_0185284696 /NCGR_PEP_ID=MMETSP1363-20130426/1252_1 /TAXON_ID=38817 /ORGANISM="Gephyrocapsa oceanica, Strain RCC1303" /LENGTH=146 /DNA_ID=CAMNT_0027880425 /DNA_START=124 /DNA_END=565 /DNA_ORIENTATION=-